MVMVSSVFLEPGEFSAAWHLGMPSRSVDGSAGVDRGVASCDKPGVGAGSR